MSNMWYLVTISILANLHQASSCLFSLSDKEAECAAPLNLDISSIWTYYDTNSDDPKFVKYLNCVWLKWNYVDKNGVILYENLKNSNALPSQMARMYEDVGSLIEQLNIDFRKAAKYCDKNRPKIENPHTVRRCIVKNYKPGPVNSGIN